MALSGHALRLSKQPAVFLRLSGLSVSKFCDLLSSITPCVEAAEHSRLSKRKRKRAVGGGTPYSLPLCDRLLMLLMYYRTYVTHAFLGFLFGLDDSNVGRCINRLKPTLAQHFRIPERRLLSATEVESFFFDGTEQPIQRPKARKPRKACYSGKKKRHTLKAQVISDKTGNILAVSKSAHGRCHDKKLYDKTRALVPPDKRKLGDTAYLGTTLDIPHKKPKGGELTDQQKQENKQHSRQRVKVEHAIGRMKRFQILAQRFRNKRSQHTLIIKNIAGLANLQAA